ncbi:flagellar hook-length control protein FliK [Fervidobacterium nodosum]|uniref:Flagellar hook-length control protein n=1 Tax=Fervidobacterium nodosum (strain ATCC 35602 / DSM 5306 / Rt17-B1) TaxID=381764 RepID=A7HN99_FERNB|nr:flagellar hook-length control protein FliK [Fervidobacterium nodosum]ABS61382.1 flagellar hook-length control protein [Fervidobacterium nodosum Rt17-B1]
MINIVNLTKLIQSQPPEVANEILKKLENQKEYGNKPFEEILKEIIEQLNSTKEETKKYQSVQQNIQANKLEKNSSEINKLQVDKAKNENEIDSIFENKNILKSNENSKEMENTTKETLEKNVITEKSEQMEPMKIYNEDKNEENSVEMEQQIKLTEKDIEFLNKELSKLQSETEKTDRKPILIASSERFEPKTQTNQSAIIQNDYNALTEKAEEKLQIPNQKQVSKINITPEKPEKVETQNVDKNPKKENGVMEKSNNKSVLDKNTDNFFVLDNQKYTKENMDKLVNRIPKSYGNNSETKNPKNETKNIQNNQVKVASNKNPQKNENLLEKSNENKNQEAYIQVNSSQDKLEKIHTNSPETLTKEKSKIIYKEDYIKQPNQKTTNENKKDYISQFSTSYITNISTSSNTQKDTIQNTKVGNININVNYQSQSSNGKKENYVKQNDLITSNNDIKNVLNEINNIVIAFNNLNMSSQTNQADQSNLKNKTILNYVANYVNEITKQEQKQQNSNILDLSVNTNIKPKNLAQNVQEKYEDNEIISDLSKSIIQLKAIVDIANLENLNIKNTKYTDSKSSFQTSVKTSDPTFIINPHSTIIKNSTDFSSGNLNNSKNSQINPYSDNSKNDFQNELRNNTYETSKNNLEVKSLKIEYNNKNQQKMESDIEKSNYEDRPKVSNKFIERLAEMTYRNLEQKNDVSSTTQTNRFELAERLQSSRNLEQIYEKIREFSLSNRIEERVQMKLLPENLGNLDIEMRKEGKQITLLFIAENEKAKDTIEKNIHILRDRLSNLDLEVKNVEIKTKEEEKYYEHERNDHQNSQQQRNEENQKRKYTYEEVIEDDDERKLDV